MTCPTCGLHNEPGARVCRNCGLPIAADNDPLRGVSAGHVEMPSAKRSGLSATVGLGLVVVLLLVAGTLAVSGGGILNSGGRFGVTAEASPSASAPDGSDPTNGDGIAAGGPEDGEPVVTEPVGTATEFTCTAAAILDPSQGKWTIAGPTPSKSGDFDRLSFRFNRRGKGKAAESTVAKLEWMSPREARDAFGLARVGGQRALVLTVEGPASINRNSRIETSQLEAANADAVRSVDVFDGDDGVIHVVAGVRGNGCARLSAPKWDRKNPVEQARVFLDVLPGDVVSGDALPGDDQAEAA